jgi:MFS family permease
MRALRELWMAEPRARLFFAAHAQSSLGTGAGYVALVVIAYERFESPWAISLVLLADFIPAMVLGPVFGAAADRWSRRWCAVVADVARAVAFIGIAFVDTIEATVALALLAGGGAGLFTPAILAAVPSLVARERLDAATSLYGSIMDVGRTAGPALAALVFAVSSAEVVSLVNGATFVVSAGVLAALPFGARPARAAGDAARGLLAEAREGLVAVARMAGIRVLLLAGTADLLFGGMINVGELLLATETLGSDSTGYSALVAVWGLGVVIGSLTGTRGGTIADLKRRYLAGLLLTPVGLIYLGVVPVFAAAFPGFFAVGLSNGLVLVHERLIVQRTVRDDLLGRTFAAADTLGSWALALSFVAAGAIVAAVGTRELFLLAGAAGVVVWALATLALRRAWTGDAGEAPAVEPAPVEAKG